MSGPVYYYLAGIHKEVEIWKEGTLLRPWEIKGLFATSEEAEAVCTTDYHFVMRLEVGFEAPDETCNDRPGWRPTMDARPEWATEEV